MNLEYKIIFMGNNVSYICYIRFIFTKHFYFIYF